MRHPIMLCLALMSLLTGAAAAQPAPAEPPLPPSLLSHPARNAELGQVVASVAGGSIRIDYDSALRSRVLMLNDGVGQPLTAASESEYLQDAKGDEIADFHFTGVDQRPVEDALGPGVTTIITGRNAAGLEKRIAVTLHDRYPAVAILRVSYVNQGPGDLVISRWVNSDYRLTPNAGSSGPPFWAYQGSSHEDRRDWIGPLKIGERQRNYMGMNASDYGGGTPIIDLWRPGGGLAVGQIETTPKLVSLPVEVGDSGADMSVAMDVAEKLPPQGRLDTLETFVAVHERDVYPTLKAYREIMADRGLKAAPVPADSYEPIWCAWGYERNFTVDEVMKAIPMAKQLGLKWVVLDDGWQKGVGDWTPDPKKFPRGDKDMVALTDAIKRAGMKPALWIAPLAVAPGSDLLHDHPDMLLTDKDGAVQNVSWWNSFYLCPAYAPTVDEYRKVIRRAIHDWGFQGLKLDGQHLNGVPECYNPAHHHIHPTDSIEHLQTFFKAIYDVTRAEDPNAVVELCPCGTSYAFYNTPYMNQSVASDPTSSWQVRSKGKVLRGLTGDSAAFSGDHVELSDKGDDFASTIGIGAVVATKFTWPNDMHNADNVFLTPAKEQIWKHWIGIYNDKMLPKGVYRGDLYDIGYDLPETHAIQKDRRMFYAFYAKDWRGPVELRGLGPGRYRLTDYDHGLTLGVVSGPVAHIHAAFTGHLLVEATPQ